MTANRFNPHLLVLPDDDANRQVANRFCGRFGTRQIQVLPETRGWPGLCRTFEDDDSPSMRRDLAAFIALIVDFDGRIDRADEVRKVIPGDIAARVFVLGASTEPETLRTAGLGHFERIGDVMASDCPPGPDGIRSPVLLTHNRVAIARFQASACSALLA